MIELLELEKDFSLDDLPLRMQDVAIRCGMHDAFLLLVKLKGLDIYVPAQSKKILNHMYVQEHYTGSNAMSLAVRLGISTVKVHEYAEDPVVPPLPYDKYDMKFVVSECGKEVATHLFEHFPGERITIPRQGIDILKRKYIEKHFDGVNSKELALSLSVGERFVRKVIAESYQRSRSLQLDLFNT